MRAVVCRVERAAVMVDGRAVGAIRHGLLVYLGVVTGDTERQAQWMAGKLPALRVFGDDDGKMNLSVTDVDGGVLLIPNFTLAARTQKGTRPSYTDAAPPEDAERLFMLAAELCGEQVITETGVFGAHMVIDSVADGPVTVVVDSPKGE